MLKDEVAQGVEVKREEHLRMVSSKYKAMNAQERTRNQQQLVKNIT